jgi:hypothetical protein
MRFLSILFLLTVLSEATFSQKADFESTTFNFGTVRDWDSPEAVFKVRNTGKTKLMFLPQKHSRDIQVILPNRSIGPGETAEIRIHYYTSDTGPFNRTVEVYSNASDKANRLTVKGSIASLRNNALTSCPTFSSDIPAASSGANIVTVADRSSGKPIAGARVEFFNRNKSLSTLETDQRGIVRTRVGTGKFTVQAESSGYFPTVQEIVFDRRNASALMLLEPMRPAQQPIAAEREPERAIKTGMTVNEQWQEEALLPDLGISINEQWESPQTADERWTEPEQASKVDLGIGINDQWEEEPPITDLGTSINDQWDEQPKPAPEPTEVVAAINDQWTETESVKPALAVEDAVEAALAASLPEPEFGEDRYRANNLVMLLDVSSSMRKEQKLDLLKESAAALVRMMRPTDRLTILAFNASVWTVLPSTPVMDAEDIISRINELESEGYTSGVKGMIEAYAQVEQHWVEQGNNQLILVTDGMFNSSSFTDKDAIMLAADNASKGIILSVVGFPGDKDASRMMERIAKRGKGSYLMLGDGKNPSTVLKDEIKSRSRIQ